jgi:CDGSH-type Zn-finger protein
MWEPLVWGLAGNKPAPSEPAQRYALCRFGQSSHKQYCDEYHTDADFEAP